MTREEIIQGLQFTIDMFLSDPSTGEVFEEPRNDMDKTTIDACKGAIELLQQEACDDAISMMDLLNNLHKHFSKGFETDEWWNSTHVLQAVKDCRPELFDLNYVSPVQPKPKMDVLDKIRAEIEETYMNITYQENSYRKATWGLRKALDIIDKYRAEFEPQESEEV